MVDEDDRGPYYTETSSLIDLLYKSMDWFLYDRNFHHEIVNASTCMYSLRYIT